MLRKRWSSLLVLPLLVACSDQRPRDLPTNEDGATITSRTSLGSAFKGADIDIVGVTVDPDDGERYVLDSSAGLYRLDDGEAVLVARNDQLRSDGAIPQSIFTDVAALGGGRFALTALNDGFLYDTNTKKFARYFCYVPGSLGDEFPMPVEQLTRSVTYDPQSDKLYAQPQTFEQGIHDEALRAEVGRFDIEGGEGYGWLPIEDTSFSAGGIGVGTDGRLVLGEGHTLYHLDLETGFIADAVSLQKHGVKQIEALAIDADHILIVDGEKDELIEVQLR